VQLSVSEGLFNVLLGDITLSGMTQALDASVFSGTDRYLRVWFSTSADGTFTQLGDQRISSVPFALRAEEAANADTLDGYSGDYYQDWNNLTNVPAGFADGVDDVGVGAADVRAGDGLTRTISGSVVTLTVQFAGTGSATTVARSDHDHWGASWSGSGTGLSLSGGSTGLDARGTTYGVYGWSDSPDGYGVYGTAPTTGTVGIATATSGFTYGVYGWSVSTSGKGVYGYASADSGYAYGVYGVSDSTSGRGVYGWASADSGTTYGVYGVSNSTSGRGVYGWASADSGTTYGVYGKSNSTSGRGVYGYAIATSGYAYGVYGKSNSTDHGKGVYGTAPKYGVYGYATATSGTTYGVYGKSSSPDGYGVYGENTASGGVALKAGGSGIIQSTADSYIFISGNEFIKDKNTDTTRWDCQPNGSVQIWRGATEGDKLIYIPITLPGVLYGQEVEVKSITVYYKCQDGSKNYITATYLYKQTDADSLDGLVSDPTNRTSNTATSYTLDVNHTLSSDMGILSLLLQLEFVDDVNYIQIGGVRVRLGHD
jgi:hypothetical protein